MSRVENLGDYNDVRILLQKFDGDKEKLFKYIGDNAVAKEAPKLLAKGGVIGGAIILVSAGIVWGGAKSYNYLKDRKKKMEREPLLKEEFNKMIDAELAEDEME